MSKGRSVRRAVKRPRLGPGAAEAPAADGRVQRGERNREAIVDALFALVGEGALEPTADQVATRAGVGLRSVFRHFTDMESLYAALDARLRAEAEPLVAAGQPSGGLAARVHAVAERRARLFEHIAPYKRSANLLRSRSPFLNAQHGALVLRLREDLAHWLPELPARSRAVTDAIEFATSFEAWDRLRGDQALSVARATAALEQMMLALLEVRVRLRTSAAS